VLVANRVNSALKSVKEHNHIEYLGCGIEDFKTHIEGSFQPGMTWDNRGALSVNGPRKWHIDHITPIKFEVVPGIPPTLEEVAERLHWTNTQALWADENMMKGKYFIGRPLIQVEAPPPLPPLPPQHMIDALVIREATNN
jgi:hypothetical protein